MLRRRHISRRGVLAFAHHRANANPPLCLAVDWAYLGSVSGPLPPSPPALRPRPAPAAPDRRRAVLTKANANFTVGFDYSGLHAPDALSEANGTFRGSVSSLLKYRILTNIVLEFIGAVGLKYFIGWIYIWWILFIRLQEFLFVDFE